MKTKLFATIMMLVAVVIMAVTTAVSFVYWKNGVMGSDESDTYPIIIGAGNAYETKINLNDAVNSGDGKRLVPYGRENPTQGLISSFTITVEVTWQAVDPSDTTNYNNFLNEVGFLTVECTSIMSSDGDQFLNKKGYGSHYVFEIVINDITTRSPAAPDFSIGGGKTVIIEIEVTMHEPASLADYDLLANKAFNMDFRFTVQSQDDLNQNQGSN